MESPGPGGSGASPWTGPSEEDAGSPVGARYQRHRPENSLLYRLIAHHYPSFLAQLASEERRLPSYVQREFEEYLRCGRLEYGFLRVRCVECHAEKLVAFSCKRRGFCPSCGARRMVESAALLVDDVLPAASIRQWVLSVPFPLRFLFATHPSALGESLGIVYRAIASFLIRKAGLTQATAQCGAITLIQRFGSALNLNVHFHMLIPDGVYLKNTDPPYLRKVPPPTGEELQPLLRRISARIGRHLERRGLLVRDMEHSYLALEPGTREQEQETLEELQSHSITYRIALGPHKGRKAFMLQSLPPLPGERDRAGEVLAKLGGFSLHAGVAAEAHQRRKLERLARYVTRPMIALERLSVTPQGNVRYALKTPYRDGTTHVIFEPLDFLARLASLVPSPRVNLTRFHGVFAPNACLRNKIVPALRGRGKHARAAGEGASAPCRGSLSWAQRLRRVFAIDIETCERCGGAVKIIACVQDPGVIRKILEHRGELSLPQRPPVRGPPGGVFD